jgi:hypothetical protein
VLSVRDAFGLEPLAEVLPVRFGSSSGQPRVADCLLIFLERSNPGTLSLVRGILYIGFTEMPFDSVVPALQVHDDTDGIDVEGCTRRLRNMVPSC